MNVSTWVNCFKVRQSIILKDYVYDSSFFPFHRNKIRLYFASSLFQIFFYLSLKLFFILPLLSVSVLNTNMTLFSLVSFFNFNTAFHSFFLVQCFFSGYLITNFDCFISFYQSLSLSLTLSLSLLVYLFLYFFSFWFCLSQHHINFFNFFFFLNLSNFIFKKSFPYFLKTSILHFILFSVYLFYLRFNTVSLFVRLIWF